MLTDAELFLLDPITEGKEASAETEHLMKVVSGLATKSKEKSTFKKYRTPWRRWIAWALKRTKQGERTVALPAEPFQVALFLAHLAEKYAHCTTVVSSAKTAINFAHRFNGLPEPTGHLGQAVSEGVKRTRGRPKIKAKPLTKAMVRQIYRKWGKSFSLWKLMIATMVSVGFTSWCRFEELASLKACDVVFKGDHMQIFIEHSKTDQYREGAWVMVAKSKGGCCPVWLMKTFMMRARARGNTPIFRTIWRRSLQKSGDLSLGTSRIGSTVFHRYFRLALTKVVGLSVAKSRRYSGHSMRRGGATAAVLARVPDQLRMSHGRWVDRRSADGYIGVPAQTALQVTKMINL